MTDVTLRRARDHDAEALAALGRRTFTDTFGHLYTPQDLETFLQGVYAPELQLQEIHAPLLHVMVVEQNGQLLGYAMTGPCKLPVEGISDTAYELQRIYLLPACKGRGIGTALLEDALRFCRDKAASDVYVGVWAENTAAQAFYRRHGFVHIGNYHFMVGEQADDEWIMRLANWKP